LRREFQLQEIDNGYHQLIIVEYQDNKIGLAVDEVIGEYQAVIKPLSHHYKSQEFISGATILGDGTVALVMDTNKAIQLFSDKKKKNTI